MYLVIGAFESGEFFHDIVKCLEPSSLTLTKVGVSGTSTEKNQD